MDTISDDYEHIDASVEYVLENILQTNATKTISFENLADQFNAFIENKCLCLDQSECSSNTCSHGNNYIRKEQNELILNENRISKDIIFECSRFCSCSDGCDNRLVQFGPRKKLKIVDCREKCLGVITLESIPEGAFICEYAGEVITRSEALRRQKFNDESNRMNFIICLNERPMNPNDGETICTFVDPSRIGNIGRYLNHSCDPNCEILSVRIDGSIPKLGKY